MGTRIPDWRSVALTAGVLLGGVIFGVSAWQAGLSRGTSATQASLEVAQGCQEFADSFQDYPLLNAGDAVLGLDMTSCQRRVYPRKDRGVAAFEVDDSVDYVYGTCEIKKGRTSCPVPIQVTVGPPCGPRLASWIETALVRGVTALIKPDGSIRIEAASFQATIYAPGNSFEERKKNALTIAEALVPANDLGASFSSGLSLAAASAESPICEANLPVPGEPTPIPPSNKWSILLDCDVVAPGVQAACSISPGETTAIDVVLVNGGVNTTVAAFGFTVSHKDELRLSAMATECLAPKLDCNPDISEQALGGEAWSCDPLLTDRDKDIPGDQSSVSCYHSGDAPPSLAGGAEVAIARVSYQAAPAASSGSVSLGLTTVALYHGDTFEELASCEPVIEIIATCAGASFDVTD